MTKIMIVKKGDAPIVRQCALATTFWSRFRGYIGRKRIDEDEGLWFPKCNSIHMWWMRVPIDVVFLKKSGSDYSISSLHENVRPWKALPVSDFSASDTLELAAGKIASLGLKKGDFLCTS